MLSCHSLVLKKFLYIATKVEFAFRLCKTKIKSSTKFKNGGSKNQRKHQRTWKLSRKLKALHGLGIVLRIRSQLKSFDSRRFLVKSKYKVLSGDLSLPSYSQISRSTTCQFENTDQRKSPCQKIVYNSN